MEQARRLVTISDTADAHALNIFRLGMMWAATLVGGSEFPGIDERGADIIARYLRSQAATLSHIPHVELHEGTQP